MDERKLAVEPFNRAWELMRRAERTAAEDDELLHVAHASRTTGLRRARAR